MLETPTLVKKGGKLFFFFCYYFFFLRRINYPKYVIGYSFVFFFCCFFTFLFRGRGTQTGPQTTFFFSVRRWEERELLLVTITITIVVAEAFAATSTTRGTVLISLMTTREVLGRSAMVRVIIMVSVVVSP